MPAGIVLEPVGVHTTSLPFAASSDVVAVANGPELLPSVAGMHSLAPCLL